METLAGLLPLVLFGLLLYLIMIRPVKARQRQALEVQSAVEPGLEVMTTAGMYATVKAVEDDVVVLEVAPGVTCRYVKAAIAKVIYPRDEAETTPTEPANGADEG